MTVYVDESTGSDDTGDGTQDAPYATPLAAMIAKGTSDLSLLVRKTPADDWTPIGTSALKKAKKAYEINERKLKKAEENKDRLEKEARELKERDARRLEESKKLVLIEDEGLPVATRVSVSVPTWTIRRMS